VCEADAGVAGGAFDQRTARLEQALALEAVEDAERRAVLHRAAGDQELRLARISQPVSSLKEFRRISGVWPMASERIGGWAWGVLGGRDMLSQHDALS